MEMNLNGGEIDVCRKCISNKIESLGIYNFPSYRFSKRIFFVFVPVLQGRFFACVGVAVFAKMRACVVFSDVFGCHAFTELPLSGIFFVGADKIMVAGQKYRIAGQLGVSE